eukprot:gene14512-5572_t
MADLGIRHKVLDAVVSQSKEFDSELSDFEEIGTPYPRGAHLSDNEVNANENGHLQNLKDASSKDVKIPCPTTSPKLKASGVAALSSIDLTRKALQRFYEKRVQPGLARKQRCEDIAYAVTHKILRKVQTVDDRFRGNGLVPHGIPYDGLRAGDSIQFEMILNLPLGIRDTLFVKNYGKCPFVRIQPMSGELWKDCITKGGFISASKIQSLLRKYVKQAVHVIRKYISQGKIEKYPKDLKSVFVEGMNGLNLVINRDIHVQILPAFCIPDSRSDFARRDCPSSSHVLCCQKNSMDTTLSSDTTNCPDCSIQNPKDIISAWRISFFVAEKNKMRSLANGCRIQLLRILTEIRDNEEVLKKISSYHLKTILFFQCDEQPDVTEWDQRFLVDRFGDLLKRLKNCLLDGSIPHYFQRQPEFPPFNLLDGICSEELEHMAVLIEQLIQDPLPYLSSEWERKRNEFWPWEDQFDPLIVKE